MFNLRYYFKKRGIVEGVCRNKAEKEHNVAPAGTNQNKAAKENNVDPAKAQTYTTYEVCKKQLIIKSLARHSRTHLVEKNLPEKENSSSKRKHEDDPIVRKKRGRMVEQCGAEVIFSSKFQKIVKIQKNFK